MLFSWLAPEIGWGYYSLRNRNEVKIRTSGGKKQKLQYWKTTHQMACKNHTAALRKSQSMIVYGSNTSGSCYLPRSTRLTGGNQFWGFAPLSPFFWISTKHQNQSLNLWYPLLMIIFIRKWFSIYYLTGFDKLSCVRARFSYPQWTSCSIWSKWVARWIYRGLTVGYYSDTYVFLMQLESFCWKNH